MSGSLRPRAASRAEKRRSATLASRALGAAFVTSMLLVPASDASAAKTVLVAGDIASCAWQDDSATADLVAAHKGTVIAAGDLAYPSGTLEQFEECYAPTWGRYRDRTRPVPGNHEYLTPGAAGYHDYFGRRAGPAGRGYRAFDLGSWRVYALDSNCSLGGGCEPGSPQHRWLREELRKHRPRCSLAVLHHPRFSSAGRSPDEPTLPLLRLLHRGGVDIVINGHEHFYERFAPARPSGEIDRDHGARQFIVGTGGAPLYPLVDPPAHSVVRQDRTHGVLRLTLRQGGYAWRFLSVDPSAFDDRGRGRCHGRPR